MNNSPYTRIDDSSMTPSPLQWYRCGRLRRRNLAQSVAIHRRFRARVRPRERFLGRACGHAGAIEPVSIYGQAEFGTEMHAPAPIQPRISAENPFCSAFPLSYFGGESVQAAEPWLRPCSQSKKKSQFIKYCSCSSVGVAVFVSSLLSCQSRKA